MAEVLNYHHFLDVPDNAVFIGRPGPWGNPFVVGRDGTREEVVAKHKEWFLNQSTMVQKCKDELRGKDLLCFCKPKACHGDIYLEVANG